MTLGLFTRRGVGRLRLKAWQVRHPEYRHLLHQQVYLITLQRAYFFSVVGLVLNLILFYAHDYSSYAAGLWEESPFYYYGVIWRATVVAGFVLFLLVYRSVHPVRPADIRPAHRVIATGYIAFLLLVGTWQSLLNQMVVADVSIFALCVLAVAALLHLPNRVRWFFYVAALCALVFGLRLQGMERAAWAGLTTNAVSVVVIAFILERITYDHQVRVFVNTALVEEKNEKLETALHHLERTQAELEAEHARKSQELEDARRLQLAMLPRRLPEHPVIDLAVHMRPAAEVGGDYYDFHLAGDGTLTFAIGDATGHGAQAGAMVTATKILFTSLVDEQDIVAVLRKATGTLKRVGLPKVYMAMALGRLRGRTLELAGAGMPPALLYRAASGRIEQVPLKGMPLGSFPDFPYRQVRVELAPHDTVVLMTDGFAELFNEAGEMLGYDRAAGLLAEVAGRTPQEVIRAFDRAAQAWLDGHGRRDDMTFVVMKVKPDV